MRLKTMTPVTLIVVTYAAALVLVSVISLSPLSVQASNLLPTGLKSNFLIQVPKNTSNLSEGYELAQGSNVSVTLRLLAPVNQASVDHGCVLASQSRNYEIVQGNLNAIFGDDVADPSFVFGGPVNDAFGAATPLEKLQNVLSNSVSGSALSLNGLDCYTLSSLSSPNQTLNYTAQAYDQRLLMVDLSVTNQAGQPVPVKLTVTIGTSPYAQLAQRAQVADQVSGTILNSQLEAIPFDDSKIPSLNASKITSGLLPLTRGGTGAGDALGALNNLLPSQAGQSGRVLSTDGTNPSWIAVPGGLVTSVAGRTGDVVLAAGDVSGLATSATTDTTNASNISSGTLNIARIPVGTMAGTVAAGDDSRFSDARAPSGSASGDLSGTYPNPTVARIQGQAVSATLPQADQVLQFSAGSWQPGYFGLGSLRTSLGAVQVTSASCGANQTLTWSAITDQISCQNIAIANTQVTGLGSLATQNSINLASDTTGSLALSNLAQSGASLNQVVRWNGASWVPSSETTPSWAAVTGKPTTLAGYGLTDAVTSALPAAQILVGNASNIATPVTVSGDAAISNAGVLTLSSTGVVADTYTKVTVNASGRVTAGTILADTDIPNLDASKITTGTLDLARLPVASDSQGGIMTTVAQSIAGVKTFLDNIIMQGNLTVTGLVEADHIKLANSVSPCDGANEGIIKYNSILKRVQYCNGIMWVTSEVFFAGCPTNYIRIPALAPYTTEDFCVAKYEMKNVSGNAVAQPDGLPWTAIPRGIEATTPGGAWKACRDIGQGYDLISNAQWQAIARNIADVPINWSSGIAYNGQLNRGHSDNSPAAALGASADDNQACEGTGQACSNLVWHNERRTHVLSNNAVIWDFAGNVYEWVKDNNLAAQGADGFVSTFSTGGARQELYGNDQFCASTTVSPWCGFGYGYVNYANGAIIRGGSWLNTNGSGVFASDLGLPVTDSHFNIGFRCVFVP